MSDKILTKEENWNLSEKIYLALKEKGANIGNASIPIISNVLEAYASQLNPVSDATQQGFMKILDKVLSQKIRDREMHMEDAKNILNSMWENLPKSSVPHKGVVDDDTLEWMRVAMDEIERLHYGYSPEGGNGKPNKIYSELHSFSSKLKSSVKQSPPTENDEAQPGSDAVELLPEEKDMITTWRQGRLDVRNGKFSVCDERLDYCKRLLGDSGNYCNDKTIIPDNF